jgi:hypothetical protein
VKKARQISSITNYMYGIGIALILIFLIPNTGEGQSKDGFYIGVGLTHSSIGGDFDGVSFVAGGGTVEAMPEIEDAFGIKYIVGFQSYIGAIDFSYNRSEHDGNWEGLEMSTVFETYNLDLKALLLRDYYSVRPFLAIGFGINRLTVEDGFTDGFFVADATFEGYALRIGGGAELSLHDQVSIDVMGLYRWERYDKVEGLVEGDLPDNIDSHGATYSAEVKFIF